MQKNHICVASQSQYSGICLNQVDKVSDCFIMNQHVNFVPNLLQFACTGEEEMLQEGWQNGCANPRPLCHSMLN